MVRRVHNPTSARRLMIRLDGRDWYAYPAMAATKGAELLAQGDWNPAEPLSLGCALRDKLEVDYRLSAVMALESDRCLAASFEAASAKRLRSRTAMLYQIEESLPVAAESIVADIVADKLHVFAVCCERTWLESLIAGLEDQRITTVAVSATPLLATLELWRNRNGKATRGIAWNRGDRIDLITCRNHRPIAWESVEPDREKLYRAWRQHQLASDCGELEVVGKPNAGDDRAPESDVLASPSGDGALTPAIYASSRVLDEVEHAAIDLLRGLPSDRRLRLPGGRRMMAAVALQTSLLLLLLSVSAYCWRAADLAFEACDDATAGQADVFRSVFPEKRVPVGVRSRLASELRRIKGVRGEDGAMPQDTPSLVVVKELLAALPDAMRFRLLEIRIEGGRLYLEGQVRRHGDADRIASALRTRGFSVAAPSTQQLQNKGVDFRLTAEQPTKTEPTT